MKFNESWNLRDKYTFLHDDIRTQSGLIMAHFRFFLHFSRLTKPPVSPLKSIYSA